MHETDEKRKIKDTYLYLRYLIKKITFKDNTIRTKKNISIVLIVTWKLLLVTLFQLVINSVYLILIKKN